MISMFFSSTTVAQATINDEKMAKIINQIKLVDAMAWDVAATILEEEKQKITAEAVLKFCARSSKYTSIFLTDQKLMQLATEKIEEQEKKKKTLLPQTDVLIFIQSTMSHVRAFQFGMVGGYDGAYNNPIMQAEKNKTCDEMELEVNSWIAISDISKGRDAFQRKDYQIALEEFSRLAEQGNLEAQFNLGYMYDYGVGVKQNDSQALKWYRLSATQGNVNAQLNLGIMYDAKSQRGIYNNVEAVRWFRMAAEQGDAQAQLNLGLMYDNGLGVEKNYSEAIKWWRMAAEQGDVIAQTNLGNKYYAGQGVNRDYEKALTWYRLAAEKGDAVAQYNLSVIYSDNFQDYAESIKWCRLAAEKGHVQAQLKFGVLYANGQGVAQNYRLAYKWFYIAGLNGNNNGIKNGVILAKIIAHEDVLSAQKSAREWLEKHK